MDTPFGPTFEDDIKQVLAEVPAPIRAFFASGKVQIAAKNLMQKNQLHIDQGTIVERELILLLLGINTPSEFTKSLVEEARLDQQIVSRIVQDVNAQIFVPLREEMRKGQPMEVKPPQPQPVAPQAPREGVLQPKTTIIPANPNLPQRPAQTLASVPRYVPPKKYFNLQNKIPPPAGSQTSIINPAKLLEDHEEPHIDISEKVQVVSPPVQLKPYNLPLKPVFEPPPNLPGVIQPPPIPEPLSPAPVPLKPSNLPLTPSVKPYSADPYREPIE